MLRRELPSFRNLRNFVAHLEARGQLARVHEPVSIVHEATEIHRWVLATGGPAILFDRPVRADGTVSDMPMLVNLFGTVERVAWGLGIGPTAPPELGEALAELREPHPPQALEEIRRKLPLARAALSMRPRKAGSAPVRRTVLTGAAIDLRRLPVATRWADEPAPLITWPLVITGPTRPSAVDEGNVGVYRMQVLGRDRVLVR